MDSQSCLHEFLFQRNLPPSFRALWSYSPSAGIHDCPSRKNVFRCVHITIMFNPALGAFPRSDAKRQFLHNMTTLMACFAGREPPVNYPEIPSIPCAFVGEHGFNLRPPRIRNGTCKAVVFDHVPHCQILDCDRLVFTNETGCQFVELVLSDICDFLVNARRFDSSFLPVLAALLFSGEVPLRRDQLLSVGFAGFRVYNFFSIAGRHKSGDPHVEADGLLNRWQFLDFNFAEKRDVPLTRGRQPDGALFGRRASRKRTAPNNI